MNLATARELRASGRHEDARDLLVALAFCNPGDAEIQYEAACVHDNLGDEASAVPYYVAAISGGLSGESLRGAYLGLGSTYRTLGRYHEAQATLREGLAAFPQANEIRVFLAMVDHNLGQSTGAVETLLALLAETSQDDAIRRCSKAIAFYAQDIDRVWLPEDA